MIKNKTVFDVEQILDDDIIIYRELEDNKPTRVIVGQVVHRTEEKITFLWLMPNTKPKDLPEHMELEPEGFHVNYDFLTLQPNELGVMLFGSNAEPVKAEETPAPSTKEKNNPAPPAEDVPVDMLKVPATEEKEDTSDEAAVVTNVKPGDDPWGDWN